MNLKGYKGNYIYSVFTYAGACGYADKVIRKELEQKNMNLNGCFNVLMPGNDATSENRIPEKENNRRILEAENEVRRIAEDVNSKIQTPKAQRFSPLAIIESDIIGKYLFPLQIESLDFAVNEKCLKCRSCIKGCPVGALKFENNTIMIDESKCVLCMKCINCCPNEAIDFGKKSIGKKRYKHPEYHITDL